MFGGDNRTNIVDKAVILTDPDLQSLLHGNFMKLIIVLAVLVSVAGLVRADTREDLANAADDFERAKIAVSSQVNKLDQEKRVAIWTQYYLALEHLQRMKVHHKMMDQHNEDRSEQFRKAYSEFTYALEKLFELVPDPGNG